jgi:hypothetical protein
MAKNCALFGLFSRVREIALFGHDQSTELKTELANTVSFPAS